MKTLITNNKSLLLKSKITQTVNDYKLLISLLAYLSVFYFCFQYLGQIIDGGHTYKTGDWLINYQAGPVRRGLIGQVLWSLSSLGGVNLLYLTFLLQISLYFLITYYTLKIFFGAERDTSWLLLLFSPAFIFLFPFYDLGGGFRKEIIVFFSFCLLAYGLSGKKIDHKYVIFSLLSYCIAVLSHELAAFCLIFYVYILQQSKAHIQNNSSINIYLVIYILFSISGLLFALIFPGNSIVSDKVCQSLVMQGLHQGICDGAIKWLKVDIYFGINEVARSLKRYLIFYPLMLFLAFFPIQMTDWYQKKKYLLLLGFIFLLPLFATGLDWGRWIHIYIFMITIILFLESYYAEVSLRKVSTFWIIAYACAWSIPHIDIVPFFGLIDFSVPISKYFLHFLKTLVI